MTATATAGGPIQSYVIKAAGTPSFAQLPHGIFGMGFVQCHARFGECDHTDSVQIVLDES